MITDLVGQRNSGLLEVWKMYKLRSLEVHSTHMKQFSSDQHTAMAAIPSTMQTSPKMAITYRDPASSDAIQSVAVLKCAGLIIVLCVTRWTDFNQLAKLSA